MKCIGRFCFFDLLHLNNIRTEKFNHFYLFLSLFLGPFVMKTMLKTINDLHFPLMECQSASKVRYITVQFNLGLNLLATCRASN